MQSRVIGMATIVAITFAHALHTARADYAFINVADTTMGAPSGTFDAIDGDVAISGSNVAFRGIYSGGEGIFVGNGGPLTTIAKTGDAAPSGTFTDFTSPAIDGADVAFSADYSGGSGVFVGSGGSLTTIATTGDIVPSTGFSFGGFITGDPGFNGYSPAISGGNVAFIGHWGESPMTFANANWGVFRGSGGALTTIAINDVAMSFDGVAISGNSVAFHDDDEIWTWNEGTITKIAETGESTPVGAITSFYSEILSISGDTVAFFVNVLSPSEFGIFVGNGGPLTPVVTGGDTVPVLGTITNPGVPSISGNTVAFRADRTNPNLPPHGFGIFVRTGDGPIEKVIVEGEPLFGSTVTGVSIGPFGLDPGGSGNLAFGYSLADGRGGVALAYVIPEPAALALIAVVTLATALRPRRCRRQSSELRETQIVLHETLATKGVRS